MKPCIYLIFLFLLSQKIVLAQSDSSLEAKQEIDTINTPYYNVDSMISYSKTFLGLKYKYGGIKPATGFDCSGFTRYVFQHFGYGINRTAREQYKQGIKITKDSLQLGDLVFFRYRNRKGRYYIGHVGMVIDIDTANHVFEFIHSCRRGVTISLSTNEFYAKRMYGFKRLIDADTLIKNN